MATHFFIVHGHVWPHFTILAIDSKNRQIFFSHTLLNSYSGDD
jgi:hypothetical protein